MLTQEDKDALTAKLKDLSPEERKAFLALLGESAPRETAEIKLDQHQLSQRLRRAKEAGQRDLLKDLGVDSLDALKEALKTTKGAKDKGAEAKPKTEEQAAAAEVLPPKKGETQGDWETRLQQMLGEVLKPLQADLAEQKAWRQQVEQAQVEQAEAEEDEKAWAAFRKMAVKDFGVKKERLDMLEAHARQVLRGVSDDVAEQMDGSDDGRKLWEDIVFAPLRADAEQAAFLFKKVDPPSVKSDETKPNEKSNETVKPPDAKAKDAPKAPVLTDDGRELTVTEQSGVTKVVSRRPATTGVRNADTPSTPQRAAADKTVADAKQRQFVMTGSESEVRRLFDAKFGRRPQQGTPVVPDDK